MKKSKKTTEKWRKPIENDRKMTEQWQVEFRNDKKMTRPNDRKMTKKWQNNYFQDSQPVADQVLPKFSGDVGIFSHPASATTWKGFLSSLGHNPSQPLVTVSSLATAPSSPCVSPGILLSDGVQCLPCPDLRF